MKNIKYKIECINHDIDLFFEGGCSNNLCKNCKGNLKEIRDKLKDIKKKL